MVFDNIILGKEFPKNYVSLVHINYEKPGITQITKDAKVTFSDGLGNIGGTLGVFLGLSIVGLVEEILSLITFVKNLRK